MNIKKNFAKICFAAASFFWVGCNDVTSPSESVDSSSSVDSGSSSVSSSSSSSIEYLQPEYGVYFDDESSSSSSELIPPMSATAYGVEPIFRSSSSTESSSSSEAEMDSLSAAAAAMELKVCDDHGGLFSVQGYRAPWTSPEASGQSNAEFDMVEKLDELLDSDEGKGFSEEKKQCLTEISESIGEMACMYGSPTPEEFDKWTANCKDGTQVDNAALTALKKDREERKQKAYNERTQEIQAKIKECDNL